MYVLYGGLIVNLAVGRQSNADCEGKATYGIVKTSCLSCNLEGQRDHRKRQFVEELMIEPIARNHGLLHYLRSLSHTFSLNTGFPAT